MHKQRFKIGSSVISWKQGRLFLMILTAPNNNIDPGSSDPFNLIFANQFKWAPYNNI